MNSDRQTKLAKYHARKVAERQQQQQQQQLLQQQQQAAIASSNAIAGGTTSIQAAALAPPAAASSSSSTIHATIQTAMISTSTNSNNNNNDGNRDAMKLLFASRRRRALAEMMPSSSQTTTTATANSTATTASSSAAAAAASASLAAAVVAPSSNSISSNVVAASSNTTTSVASSAATAAAATEGGGGSTSAASANGGTTQVISAAGIAAAAAGGTGARERANNTERRLSSESSSNSTISSTTTTVTTATAATATSITSRSRRALDRYLGAGVGKSSSSRLETAAGSGRGGGDGGGSGGGSGIASKSISSASTDTSSSSSQDSKDGRSNDVGGGGSAVNALVPTSTTTTTAAAATMTMTMGGTKQQIIATTTSTAAITETTTNPSSNNKEVAKSVRFKLLSPMKSPEMNKDVDSRTTTKSCYSSVRKEHESPYDEKEKGGVEERPYDEEDRVVKMKHESRNNMNKAQCSPPRRVIQSSGIGGGGGGGGDDSGRGTVTPLVDDEGWVVVDVEPEDDNREDAEEFAMFVEGLRREVAGDHTELWAGFQALFGRAPGERVPLCTLSSNHNDDDDGGDNSTKDASKKKKVKMDPRTQNSLTAIHRHLMEDSRIKSKFMTTSSQLVNDKKVRKGRARMVGSGGDGDVVDDKGHAGRLETDYSVTTCERNQRHAGENANDNKDAVANSAPEDPSTLNSLNEAGGEAQQQQQHHAEQDPNQHRDKRESWLQSYKDKKSAHLSGRSKLKITTFPSPRSKNGDKSFGREEPANDPKRRLSWMEALKAKQRTLRSKQSADSDNTDGNTSQASQVESGPVSPLSTLRMISPRKKSRSSPPSTPKGAPWLNVQLRSTPKPRSSMASDWTSSNAAPSLSNNFVMPPTNYTSQSQPSENSPSSTLPELCCVGDIIDLGALPAKVFPAHEGDATILPLKQSAKDPSKGGGEVEKVVIVGRTALATANIIPSSTIDAPRKASITWWCRRSEIRTLTLNVEATGANLAHVHGRTPLLFDSADVCLDFAQSFYRGPTTKSDETVGTTSTSNQKGSDTCTNSDEGEVNGDASNLTEDEESLLDRYRQYSQIDRTKLRLTCLSPQGGNQEMEVELSPASRVTQHAFTKPTSVASATTTSANNAEAQSCLSMEEETTASKYRKMLKMGIPPDAVQHKMTSDDISSTIMAAVLEGAVQDKANAGDELTSEEEVIADKYRKMLKMGVPLDGVKHKMTQENVDLKIVSVLVREASPSSKSEKVESNNNHQSKMTAKVDGPLLTAEEEAIATTYRNMLKVCIPKEAVRHKMKQEGVTDKIVEAVLGKEATVASGSDYALQAKATNRKTIAFHWTTSNLAPELLEQSIFGRTELKKRKLALVNPEESDIKKLEEIFQKRDNSNTSKIKTVGHVEDAKDMAKLLDLTRANNIAISLKSFNDFTFRSLAETIGDLDPDCKIVGERVQFIPNLLPTPKEMQAIKSYKGDEDKLITAEIFFRQLIPIKRIEDKVKVMRAMSTFEEHVAEVRAGLKTLQEVCGQVMNSEKLIQVLEMVLNIGNLMNAGTLHGGVEAFKFESLPKLSETKSADGKTTVLDYIVETFIEKGERQALFLMSEFPNIQDSSRLSIGDLMNDMMSIRNDYKLCTKELASMKRDQRSKGSTKTSMQVTKGGEVEDQRKAMFAAIQSRGSKEDGALKQPPDPRQALFAAIKSRNVDIDAGSEDDTPESGAEYTPGIHRLQKFLIHSKSILSIANEDLDAAIRACKGLALYCGEEGGERSAASLLQVLSNFALSLENGVKKYDQRVEAEKKRAARRNSGKGKENNQNANSVSTTRLLKSSSLQPHAGILDKGKGLNSTSSSRGGNPMNAILNAIKDRGAQLSEDTPDNGVTTSTNSDSRQALLASIKNRRGSLPNNPPPDGVPDRIKHINNNIARKESRVLLVNRMLSKAPPSVKEDFLNGVTYKETDDPLLRKIYDKESNTDGGDVVEQNASVVRNWKAVDPRQELFAAIKGRRSND